MMLLINISAMILAAFMLLWMMMSTRCHDSVGWWAFRLLACYALVCFVYLAYDTFLIGNNLPIRYTVIRFGCLALVAAMLLSWRLISAQNKKVQNHDFSSQLTKILKKGK
ncbi:hypothetical protein [Psychrobacter urativorans]|uniref:Uncharacterized protein n=1 Tax=Psychrobacter urativorans TaxID=45610 RepID=A0A0M3V950_9GAMM|nr:hypothetical protein [Psychrobacter urativorans]ALF60333.1 hypothetical protein AOC03_10015 [Psychrobacter urativorans]